jgi:small subunit ribosomal protein S1
MIKKKIVNTRLFGKVSNLTDYGAFIEIETGIEGLVHVSEMDWTNKNIHPSKAVQLGDEIEVMILEIDEDRRRLSLGMKQCQTNPWNEFSTKHNKDDKISGSIKSITDFGIFIGLDGGIDGLIHLSDISWAESGEEAVQKYKKGDEVEALIISIDVEKERISLGIKQLTENPNPESETTAKEEDKPAKKPAKKEAKKESVSDEPKNGGTTNLGALLQAKLDDKK